MCLGTMISMAGGDAVLWAKETVVQQRQSCILPPHLVCEDDEVNFDMRARGYETRWPPAVEEVTWLCEGSLLVIVHSRSAIVVMIVYPKDEHSHANVYTQREIALTFNRKQCKNKCS